MVYLIFDKSIKEISDDIFKISTYIDDLQRDRKYEDEPIPLLHANEKIYDIFKEWFDILISSRINYISDHPFNVDFFKKYNLLTLLEIFEFAIFNHIRIICETIAYLLREKNIKIYNVDDKYYIINGEPEIDNNKLIFESIRLNTSLALMILNHNKPDLYNEENDYNLVHRSYDIEPRIFDILFDIYQNHDLSSSDCFKEICESFIPDNCYSCEDYNNIDIIGCDDSNIDIIGNEIILTERNYCKCTKNIELTFINFIDTLYQDSSCECIYKLIESYNEYQIPIFEYPEYTNDIDMSITKYMCNQKKY